jgi:CBS domain-containing protein
MKAKDIMTKTVISVREDTTIEEVIKTLLENEISGVPVLDENDKLVGLVSEGDLIYREGSLMPVSSYEDREKFKEQQSKALQAKVESTMTKEVITVDEETPAQKIAALLLRHRIKRVPVIRDGKVVGIVSRANVMSAIAKKMSE